MSPEGGENPSPAPAEIAEAANNDNYSNWARNRYEASRHGQYEKKLNFSSYRLPEDFLDDSVDASIGGNGHDIITMWLSGQNSPHGATNINEYAMGSLFESFSLRLQKDSFISKTATRVMSELNEISVFLTEKDVDGHDGVRVLSDDEKNQKEDLLHAIAKDRLIEVKNNLIEERQTNKNKKSRGVVLEEIPETVEFSVEETMALMKHERRVRKIEGDCGICGGEFGKALEARTSSRVEILRDEILLKSGLLVEGNLEDKKIIERVTKQLELQKKKEVGLIVKMTAAKNLLEETIKNNDRMEWLQLMKSMVGAASVFNGAGEMMKNASDLEPISRMWDNQGRMVEMHPSNWVEMVKRWPSFEEGFRGLSAIASGKYALGSNGEIYPTGAYGLGYVVNQDGLVVKRVEKNEDGTEKKVFFKSGEIIDVDAAYKVVDKKRTETLIPGVTRLNENQIWVNGEAVNVDNIVNPDKKGKEKFDGYNGSIEISGNTIKIFSKNILYWGGGINDENVSRFMNDIKEYVKGVEAAKGKKSWDSEVNLGVELARNFFEMSLLSSWYGVPRDSKGKPYYGLYNMDDFEEGKNSPKRKISEMEMWKISSNSESDAVRFGIIANGWDEGSLFPFHVNDWGKLTLTRSKQMSEIWKGRKHGLYPLMPYLPESIAQPMLGDDIIRGVIEGEDSKYKLEKVFGDMNSVSRLKTFWLDIAKGIAVYEFISSTFIGDKDPLKANEELIAMMMNPKNFEALNKNIDLSVLYVDDWEAARLKVNIVTAALSAVAREYYKDEFLGIGPQGTLSEGKVMSLSQINENFLLDKLTEEDGLKGALKQLVVSRFVGDEKDVMKILNKIIRASEGKSDIGFGMEEFKATFGEDYLDKVWKVREKRRNAVFGRKPRRR